MKLTRGRLTLVLVSLVAIVLLGIMIGLQLLIILNPSSTRCNRDPANQVQPATTIQILPTNTPRAPAMAAALPVSATATAVPPTPTLTQPPPTITPVPPTLTSPPPTATLAQPTPTLAPQVAIATPVPTVAATATAIVAATATNTLAPPADIRLGDVDREENCKFFTDIVQLVLTSRLICALRVFICPRVDDLFAALGANEPSASVDITLCYIDPDDRNYLEQYGSSFRLMNGNYAEHNNKKLFVIGNSAFVTQQKMQGSCGYSFLRDFNLTGLPLQGKDAAQWLEQNSEHVKT